MKIVLHGEVCSNARYSRLSQGWLGWKFCSQKWRRGAEAAAKNFVKIFSITWTQPMKGTPSWYICGTVLGHVAMNLNASLARGAQTYKFEILISLLPLQNSQHNCFCYCWSEVESWDRADWCRQRGLGTAVLESPLPPKKWKPCSRQHTTEHLDWQVLMALHLDWYYQETI